MIRRSLPLALGLAVLACTTSEPDAPEVPTDIEYCAEVVDWDDEWSDLERELLERVNLYREAGATCGATAFEPAEPLIMNESLRCAARVHARDMGTRDYVMHTTPEGVGFAERAEDAGYEGGPVGQNIAVGLAQAESVVIGWMGSEGTCTNIMSPDTNELGAGYFATDEASFGTYWVLTFGVGAS